MPQVFLVALGAVGAALAARLLLKEWQRINADLERVKTQRPDARERVPSLRRDPATGEYRPHH